MNNNEIFNEAFGNVDLKYIENTARAPKRKSAILMRVMPIAAAVAILATCVIATFSMANRNKPEVPGADDPAVVPPVVDTEPERTNTIVEGAFKLVPDTTRSGHILQPWQCCAYAEAYSYYLKNEKIYIKINFGFADNDYAKKFASGEMGYPDWGDPSYALVNANPTIRCYATLINYYDIKDAYENVLINGSSKYFHMFDEENLDFGYITEIYERYDPELDKTKIYVTPIFNCSEMIELDFSNVPVGTSGKIIVDFGWCEPDLNEFDGRGPGQWLYFYVGENGIGFSFKRPSKERSYAKENVEIIENANSSITESEMVNGWKERFGMPSNDTNNEE